MPCDGSTRRSSPNCERGESSDGEQHGSTTDAQARALLLAVEVMRRLLASSAHFDFAFWEALAFMQRVGELAETEGHHPDISLGWGYETVSLRTKKIKGLHENDFIMAGKIRSHALVISIRGVPVFDGPAF